MSKSNMKLSVFHLLKELLPLIWPAYDADQSISLCSESISLVMYRLACYVKPGFEWIDFVGKYQQEPRVVKRERNAPSHLRQGMNVSAIA